jgi:signal peptidase I
MDMETEPKENSRNPGKKKKKVPEKVWNIISIAILATAVLFVTVFRIVKVNGSSMYPTLQDGQLRIVNQLAAKTGHIHRFDIVVIKVTDTDGTRKRIIKRVIGMPGETVSYTDGQLYINGEAMDEPFLDEDYVASYNGSFMSDVEEITLGDDEYYCLGDNRPHSSDSRYYGPFKKDQITAVESFWKG